MKNLVQLILFFAILPATGEPPATEKEMVALCIKNATDEAGKGSQRTKVCECSVKKTIEHLKGEMFKNKDAKPRIEWLKKMYGMTLTPKDVEDDPYDILEFNIQFTQECLKKHKK